jgi:KipI family sensor histidine kinase inhibitor
VSSVRLLAYGDAALLLDLEEPADVLAWRAALARDPPAGTVDIVPAARTVLLRFDPDRTTAARVAAAVRGMRPAAVRQYRGDLVEIPVRYDGADLDEVGRITGLGPAGVVAAHTAAEWTVAFCGFAPGFGYLVADTTRLRVPRRAEARVRVPAGAVGLAGEYSGVYPRSSPGGWQLIGSTDRRIWNPQARPPALLRPGVRVRFVSR